MKKKRFNNAFWLGLAATEVYRFYNGKGIFNKPRFSKQHKAIEKYIDTNYPGAHYTPISIAGNGWATIIKTQDNKSIPLYLYKIDTDNYIFKEGTQV